MTRAGAATRIINGEIGACIQAATRESRAKAIRDDLEANALYLADDDSAVLMVSCDLVGLEPDFVAQARTSMAEAAGIESRDVIIAATHTHNGPSLIPTNYLTSVDEEYMARLEAWLAELAKEAVSNARPARLAWGSGNAQIGYNRRCCWADGTATMHGNTKRDDFVGLEGPDDPGHMALFAEDMDRRLIAVLHSNTAHPTCFYGATFYSADYPGLARRCLREALGEMPVLYLNGAIGDISIHNLLAPRPTGESGEQKMSRAGYAVAGETLRLLHEARFEENAVIGHAREDLKIPVRLPSTERIDWARKVLAKVDAGDNVAAWDRLFAHGAVLLLDRFGERPIDTVPVHAVRFGSAAIVTQPCELFCEFGLTIKERSPAARTAVCGPADGYNGYCPTRKGIAGGGYSGEPIYWTRLHADAGDMIVHTASRLLQDLW